MSAFGEMQDLLSDFLAEAGELLDDVDHGLVDLEKHPEDEDLLNRVFRGFHTIKGGAGFLEATPLVELCHRGENLLDLLRKHELILTPEIMDHILDATSEVRRMFDQMESGVFPSPASDQLLRALELAADPNASLEPVLPVTDEQVSFSAPFDDTVMSPTEVEVTQTHAGVALQDGELDWVSYYNATLGKDVSSGTSTLSDVGSSQVPVTSTRVAVEPSSVRPSKAAPAKKSLPQGNKESTIRVDTTRFDQILNLSGEIGLTKNRLNSLRSILNIATSNPETAQTVDQVLAELDMLVSDLQSAVMKARMQPVGRVFQKYSRLARDLGRQLGKEVELVISGAETEVDKTILEELNDPLVHLIRNSVDHGVETVAERLAIGKASKGVVHLSARQTGDSIVIEIEDDGKGIDPEVIRRKAVEKGVITLDQASTLDPQQCLHLIFMAGFSTKTEVSDVSGRGVGMDVVRTNIEKLKGRIDIQSVPNRGSKITISLPLTLAILPVLMLRLLDQIYALPLNSVREIITLNQDEIQLVNGEPTLVIRGEVLPIFDLASVLGLSRAEPAPLAVVFALGTRQFVLAVDGFVGQDEVMIKPLQGLHSKGVAGATLSGDGTLVLVLEMKELLDFGNTAINPLDAMSGMPIAAG